MFLWFKEGRLLVNGFLSLQVLPPARRNCFSAVQIDLLFYSDMAQAVQAARRILAMREPDSVKNATSAPPALLGDSTGGCEVEFSNVRFKYATRETPVFRNLSLKIEKGQFAAFVGASGCGKTTTISLLERFYEVDKGAILIDGQKIQDLDIVEYRKVVSLVSQEPVLYQGKFSVDHSSG